jgi:hypothetical protein
VYTYRELFGSSIPVSKYARQTNVFNPDIPGVNPKFPYFNRKPSGGNPGVAQCCSTLSGCNPEPPDVNPTLPGFTTKVWDGNPELPG